MMETLMSIFLFIARLLHELLLQRLLPGRAAAPDSQARQDDQDRHAGDIDRFQRDLQAVPRLVNRVEVEALAAHFRYLGIPQEGVGHAVQEKAVGKYPLL